MGVGLAVITLLIALMQVVLCKNWIAKFPQSIKAISGSCVTIPCHFEVPNNHEANILNCSRGAVWRKGAITGPPVYSGQTLGDLTKKNCTTVFDNFPKNHNDTYFFRLECPNDTKFTFINGVNISIQQGPSPPVLTSVTQVSEGIQVMRLKCSVPVSCHALPPSLIWLPRDNSRQEQTQILQNPDGQMTMVSTLTFITSADLHNQSIICSVSYPLTKGGSTEPSATARRLNILYAPRFTRATLSASGPVSEGHIVTFTCFSDANPPARSYTWYRDDSGKLIKKGEGGALVLQVTKTDSGSYLCEAQNRRGSQRSRFVSLEVIITAGSEIVIFPYIICGVVVVLFIITLVVNVYKYRSLSRRLKQIELKGEHTYTNLKSYTITSEYDQLQPRQPPPESPDYENSFSLQASHKNQPLPKQP